MNTVKDILAEKGKQVWSVEPNSARSSFYVDDIGSNCG